MQRDKASIAHFSARKGDFPQLRRCCTRAPFVCSGSRRYVLHHIEYHEEMTFP